MGAQGSSCMLPAIGANKASYVDTGGDFASDELAESDVHGSTHCWRPCEQSLARDSFNAISKQSKLDPTVVLMTDGTMGRKSMMGPDWKPSGIVSREIAELLSKKSK